MMTPQHVHNMVEEASKQVDLGNISVALDMYLRVYAETPDNYDVCLTTGAICGELGRLNEAQEFLLKAIKLQPLNVDGHLTLAHVLKAKGDILDAIKVLDVAVQITPSDAYLFCTLGALQREVGQPSAALRSFVTATKLDSTDPTAWVILGELFEAETGYLQALAAYRNAHDLLPHDANVTARLVSMLKRLNENEEAENLVTRGLQEFPNNPYLLHQAGGVFCELGKHTEALTLSARALHILPDDPNMQIGHALILARTGDHERAFEILLPLLELEEPPIDAMMIFANISHLLDSKDECRVLLQVASERNPLSVAERVAIQNALSVLDQPES